MKYAFDWDPAKERRNRRKHDFSFREASSVFRDPLAVSIYDEEHSFDEDRWVTIGQTPRGNVLVVVHTFRRVDEELTSIRLISARRASRSERRQYEERT